MARLEEIRVADIEEGDPVEVVEVLVREGDAVARGQPLLSLETEKALVEYLSPHAGQVKSLHVQPADQVVLGDLLAVLEVEGAARADEPDREAVPAPAEPAASEPASPPQPSGPAEPGRPGRAYASPGIHRYADELGVELGDVQGSGRNARILKQDVQQHVQTRMRQPAAQEETGPLPDFTEFGETEIRPQTGIQRHTARNLLAAWRSIPHVTHFEQADVTGLERCRRQLAGEAQAQGVRLTPLPFVIKALAATLEQYPQFNASLDPEAGQLVLKKYFHIGVAVDTPHGLLVPVLRDVDRKPLVEVARELEALAAQARSRKLKAGQMTGASMTVSSLGKLGGEAFTPIINPPEVAILGLSRMLEQDTPEKRKWLPLSLSYDHRVINGAEAARFCSHLKAVLEDIWKLVLD
ncbi:MAG: 2-oxo acid dehydrogenase subunit E2 [Gammaproteobacteria bacterium]|nr:2-oxo acid dehydrogenase subunit E2 [Gammaproteobacteria bacterium]